MQAVDEQLRAEPAAAASAGELLSFNPIGAVSYTLRTVVLHGVHASIP